jgi:hypothetical protein
MTTQQHGPEDDASGTVVSGPAPHGPAFVPAQPSTAPEDGLVGDGIPNAIVPGDQQTSEATAEAVARLAEMDLPAAQRRQALGQIAAGLTKRGFKDFFKPKAAMTWIADTVVDVAPRIPIRSLERLREHFPGLSDEQIADRLVRNAGRTSGSIGAVGGGVSAIQWAAPPTLLTAPALLAAETVAVVAVELKLIGELQELYGQSVPGATGQRALTLLQAWAGRRGVSLMAPGRGLAAVLGTSARHELRDRLVSRFGRNLTALGPLFTGAAVAAYLNRRATLRLADEVRKDLSRRVPRQITP